MFTFLISPEFWLGVVAGWASVAVLVVLVAVRRTIRDRRKAVIGEGPGGEGPDSVENVGENVVAIKNGSEVANDA